MMLRRKALLCLVSVVIIGISCILPNHASTKLPSFMEADELVNPRRCVMDYLTRE